MATKKTDGWDYGVVFLKSQDKEGLESHTAHTCWDKNAFIKNCHASAIANGGTVEQITEDEYRKATQRK